MKRVLILLGLLCVLTAPGQAMGSDIEARIRALEETLQKQEQTIKEQQRVIGELKAQIKTVAPAEVAKSVEKPPEVQKAAQATGLFGGSFMTNPNISLVLNTFAQSSNLSDEELRNHGIPGYTTIPHDVGSVRGADDWFSLMDAVLKALE